MQLDHTAQQCFTKHGRKTVTHGSQANVCFTMYVKRLPHMCHVGQQSSSLTSYKKPIGPKELENAEQ